MIDLVDLTPLSFSERIYISFREGIRKATEELNIDLYGESSNRASGVYQSPSGLSEYIELTQTHGSSGYSGNRVDAGFSVVGLSW